jgi:hypothetical protein
MKVITLLALSPAESVYRFKITIDEFERNNVSEWLQEHAKGQYAIWPCIMKDHYTVDSGYTVEVTGTSVATMFRIMFSD